MSTTTRNFMFGIAFTFVMAFVAIAVLTVLAASSASASPLAHKHHGCRSNMKHSKRHKCYRHHTPKGNCYDCGVHRTPSCVIVSEDGKVVTEKCKTIIIDENGLENPSSQEVPNGTPIVSDGSCEVLPNGCPVTPTCPEYIWNESKGIECAPPPEVCPEEEVPGPKG